MKELKKGFTLIELLVVIAIIGILATTLAPKLREQLAKAKDAKAIALLGVVRTAGSVVLVDKMVANTVTTNGTITMNFSDVKAKLDTKSQAMVSDTGTNIAIGGSRLSDDLAYGGTINVTTTDGAIDVSKDEAIISFEPTGGINDGTKSTEGKVWAKY